MDLYALMAWAMAVWGLATPFRVVEHDTTFALAWYAPVDGVCEFHWDLSAMESYDESRIRSTALHEAGHCGGLDHYGDCNSNYSIMGCATSGRGLGEFDSARMAVVGGYSLSIPGLSHD